MNKTTKYRIRNDKDQWLVSASIYGDSRWTGDHRDSAEYWSEDEAKNAMRLLRETARIVEDDECPSCFGSGDNEALDGNPCESCGGSGKVRK